MVFDGLMIENNLKVKVDFEMKLWNFEMARKINNFIICEQ